MKFLIFLTSIVSASAQITLTLVSGSAYNTEVITTGIGFSNFENFNSSKPTVMYIHDWKESIGDKSSTAIFEAFLLRGEHNVAFVDWFSYSDELDYVTTARKIEEVSLHAAVITIRHVGIFQKIKNLKINY